VPRPARAGGVGFVPDGSIGRRRTQGGYEGCGGQRVAEHQDGHISGSPEFVLRPTRY